MAGTILDEILAHKAEEVAARRSQRSLADIEQAIADAPETRGFVRSLTDSVAAGQAAVIAEVKKASPSKGVIRNPFSPVDIAKSYEKGGAACLSVLTDVDFFQGADHHLVIARDAVGLPVIRKDFIVDEYSVYEARALGADCILLIAAILEPDRLQSLNNLAHELGMDVLVEVHDRQELKHASTLPNRLIGINNRNLNDFTTDLNTTLSLMDDIEDRIIVTESGIHTREHVSAMRDKSINAFLVGEAFMRADDPGKKLEQLFF